MANWKGTPVPNTGVVENVYFNTNMSVSETETIIKEFCIENIQIDEFGDYVYFVLTNDEFNKLISLSYSPSKNLVNIGYSFLENENLQSLAIFSNQNIDGFNLGWSLNTISINDIVIGDSGDGILIGNLNEKLSSLFSITPFTQSEDKNILMHPKNEDGTANKDVNLYPRTKVGNLLASNGSKFTMPNVVYKQGGGTAVPNSGLVENVYFNTNLTKDEVVAILDTLENLTNDSYMIVVGEDMSPAIQIGKHNTTGWYDIAFFDSEGSHTIFSSVPENSLTQGKGWAENLGFNFIEFNKNVLSEAMGFSIGTENDKLSSLFSITPFTSGGLFETNEDGTPNTDKPIQTGISEERVNELIDLKITGVLGGEY